MEFFNIGSGELLVIVLLALILFGPEDIVKLMRTLGRYTRSAREMWNEFSSSIEQEYAMTELTEVLDETKASFSEAEKALGSLKTSVDGIGTAVEEDVTAAQKSLESQATASLTALEEQTAEARVKMGIGTVPTLSGWKGAYRSPAEVAASQTAEAGSGESTDVPAGALVEPEGPPPPPTRDSPTEAIARTDDAETAPSADTSAELSAAEDTAPPEAADTATAEKGSAADKTTEAEEAAAAKDISRTKDVHKEESILETEET